LIWSCTINFSGYLFDYNDMANTYLLYWRYQRRPDGSTTTKILIINWQSRMARSILEDTNGRDAVEFGNCNCT
jgi:hypothetical protein